MSNTELVIISEWVVKELILTYKSVTSSNKSSAKTLSVKSPMQDLRWKLFFTEVGNGKINKMFDIQTSEFFLKAILIESSEVTNRHVTLKTNKTEIQVNPLK
ncbi:9884_t:CDS:2, partial [Funneliformis mosseae]